MQVIHVWAFFLLLFRPNAHKVLIIGLNSIGKLYLWQKLRVSRKQREYNDSNVERLLARKIQASTALIVIMVNQRAERHLLLAAWCDIAGCTRCAYVCPSLADQSATFVTRIRYNSPAVCACIHYEYTVQSLQPLSSCKTRRNGCELLLQSFKVFKVVVTVPGIGCCSTFNTM